MHLKFGLLCLSFFTSRCVPSFKVFYLSITSFSRSPPPSDIGLPSRLFFVIDTTLFYSKTTYCHPTSSRRRLTRIKHVNAQSGTSAHTSRARSGVLTLRADLDLINRHPQTDGGDDGAGRRPGMVVCPSRTSVFTRTHTLLSSTNCHDILPQMKASRTFLWPQTR